jgi:hypothetical protein
MKITPRPGSQLAAENKENRLYLIIAAVITALIFCCVFVFNTQLKEHMQYAGTLANIGGGLLILGSWAWLYFGAKEFWDAKGVGLYFLALVLGIFLSCGFNFGDHGTSQQQKIDNGGSDRQAAEDQLKK